MADEKTSSKTMPENKEDVAAVAKWGQTYKELAAEISKVIVGQTNVIEQMIVAILARGHALLEGVPGVGKTLMVLSASKAMNLSFSRVQFTPDLMPSDITGTDVLQEDPITHEHSYKFMEGPIFANIVLADEINRTPPKTQAAMLEAMQERMISAGGENYKLPSPFFVLATQNPLGQEGTYPLPEAQRDRFLLHIRVDYPSGLEEWEIADKVTTGTLGDVNQVLDGADIIEAQNIVLRMPVCDQVVGYALQLVRASRPGTSPWSRTEAGGDAPESITQWINWGAGPRGVLTLISCAKARALIHGRYHASVDDINWVIGPSLRHRIGPNYAALAAGVTSEEIIDMLMKEVPASKEYAAPVA
ncbi:MAG: MoxR family ATPase [Kiritimatiellia bacterium]|jgi:MoxR-like ATPase|nr:MoxR family ATPase [Kiritimatiellia bacterium]